MRATFFMVDDLLVDTGFSHAGGVVLKYLKGQSLRAVALTHQHEDHSGNCAAIQKDKSCTVLLSRPDLMWADGVGELKTYRSFFWGKVAPYLAEAMPTEITTARRVLQVVPAPGHSEAQVAFFDDTTGSLFAGDAYISPGASATMPQEDPYAIIKTLKRLAELPAEVLYNGHGLALKNPGPRLTLKAERVERAVEQVTRLHDQGRSLGAIVNRVFPRGRLKDWWLNWMTRGDFDRKNFVRACIRGPVSRTGRAEPHTA